MYIIIFGKYAASVFKLMYCFAHTMIIIWVRLELYYLPTL